jgi:hypothetical protein
MPSVHLLMPGVALLYTNTFISDELISLCVVESTGAIKEGVVETSLKDKQRVSTAETTDPVYRIAEFTFENKQPKFFKSPSFSLLRASWQYPNTLSPILVISV